MNSTQPPYLRRVDPYKRGVKFESSHGARGRAGSRDLEMEDVENRAENRTRGGGARGGAGNSRDLEEEGIENRVKGSEYTLEPEALNEKVEYDTKSPSRPHTSPYLSVGSARKYTPHLSASRSVQFTPTPFSSSSSSLPVSSSSYVSPPRGTPAYSSAHHVAPSSSAVGNSSSSHSNVGAVFGKPPKFGSWDKSRPTLEGAEVSLILMVLTSYNSSSISQCFY